MRRRNWLKLGAAATAVLVVGGGAAALVAPGLRYARLTPDSRIVMGAIGGSVLDGVLPADPSPRRLAIDGLLDRVDQLVSGLPAHAQGELSQLLALLSTAAGRVALTGLGEPWTQARPAQVQVALQSMRTSSLALRQQAYLALHDIVGAAYFSAPSTWAVLGYPGPVAV